MRRVKGGTPQGCPWTPDQSSYYETPTHCIAHNAKRTRNAFKTIVGPKNIYFWINSLLRVIKIFPRSIGLRKSQKIT